ncbi:hypothetical protein AAKU55_000673 [Oxalobacteraceae bacterium GrIS 1.11]
MRSPTISFSTTQLGPLSATNAGTGAGEASDPTPIGMARFDELAGIKHHHVHQPNMPLARRLVRPPRTALPASVDDEHGALRAGAAELLEALSDSDDGGKAEERLAERYDPLQRYVLLSKAAEMLDQQEDGLGKDELSGKLDTMLADLMAQHGAAITSGLEQADALDGALELMSQPAPGTDGADSMRQLRAQYGPKGGGALEQPLTPAGLFASLLERAGAARVGKALSALRKKMADSLYVKGRGGPRLWLSLSDAASFNVVQTSYAMAGDLRRDLSEQAAVAPRADQAETAAILLNLGQGDGEQADTMLERIVGPEKMSPLRQVAALRLLRGVVGKLPPAIWSQAGHAQRQPLIENLQRAIVALHPALPSLAPTADLLESRLRLSLKPSGTHHE